MPTTVPSARPAKIGRMVAASEPWSAATMVMMMSDSPVSSTSSLRSPTARPIAAAIIMFSLMLNSASVALLIVPASVTVARSTPVTETSLMAMAFSASFQLASRVKPASMLEMPSAIRSCNCSSDVSAGRSSLRLLAVVSRFVGIPFR